MDKKLFAELFGRTVLLAAIVGGLYVAHMQTLALKEKRAQALVALEQAPNRALEATAQKADLARRSLDIKRIEQYLIARSDIVQVISAMETLAQQRNVTVQVPTIAEVEEVVDEENPEAAQQRPGRDVKIQVSVDGNPQDIIAFAHGVEHLPYLITLDQLALNSKPQIGGQGESLLTAARTSEEQAPQPSHSELVFILSVAQENG